MTLGSKRPFGSTSGRSSAATIQVHGADTACRELSPISVNHLPCRIMHDGPANVTAFWREECSGTKAATIVGRDGKHATVKRAAFRGRLLLGAELPLPQGTKGFVFQPRRGGFCSQGGATKRIRAENESTIMNDGSELVDQNEEKQHWDCMETFNSINVWNYDQTPSDADEMRRWTDWFKISAALAE